MTSNGSLPRSGPEPHLILPASKGTAGTLELSLARQWGNRTDLFACAHRESSKRHRECLEASERR
jgi:hypothetical protein